MILDKKKISNIDLRSFVEQITRSDHRQLFLNPPGTDHYALLAYISMISDDLKIIELGTHHGTSSLAFSVNPKTTIITYDIRDQYGILNQPKNVERRIGNIFDLHEEYVLLDADLIFVDTAHDGDFELKIYEYLVDNNYKGLLLLDDIHWNKPMKLFWNNINKPKYDITDLGHGVCIDGIAGTGIVSFGPKISIIDGE